MKRREFITLLGGAADAAARGARATAGDSGDWVSQEYGGGCINTSGGSFPARIGRDGLRGRP